MTDESNDLAATLFSEILAVDQLTRASVTKVLPRGMELSHFSVLNHLAHSGVERSPGELARTFHLTRGAMTNTLGKLEWAGWVHIRPDWDDARRKMVAISPAGVSARNAAIQAISPMIAQIVKDIGPMRVRGALPVLRELRQRLADAD
ncbi:DNA-binding MarR family transcriptional regulator [Loktanella ponticola]|uniref:DNA-binding MarR family transcriptional regulator n=1 Tax=Yoonia ponticola TaxID=1524255 RepID=A0A7W9BJR0_9RHOB|nr:MarR family transcriptional regulator [Yoonia ponticola]MBB5721349.1 DNA-binding MarR family transcriptional regulator [Yoonia ponticola]